MLNFDWDVGFHYDVHFNIDFSYLALNALVSYKICGSYEIKFISHIKCTSAKIFVIKVLHALLLSDNYRIQSSKSVSFIMSTSIQMAPNDRLNAPR